MMHRNQSAEVAIADSIPHQSVSIVPSSSGSSAPRRVGRGLAQAV
jgi:hypothetical protein